jgi:uncharacterized membrane protein YfcA
VQLLIYGAACVLGQFLQTTIGFGLNIIVMALATALFPVTTLASACTLLSMCSSGFFAWKWRKKLRFQAILWPLITMLGVSTAAIATIRYIPVKTLQGFLGLALIAMSIFFLGFQSRIHIHASPARGLAVGGIAGVLAGYFSTGGPPVVAYLLETLDDKETYLACIQTVFFISNLWNTIFRGFSGYLTGEVFRLSAVGAICVVLGAFWGTRLLGKLNFSRLRVLAYIFIGLCGLWIAANVWLIS